MNATTHAMQPQVRPRQGTNGMGLLLLAACALFEADPMVGLAVRAGLYLWRRQSL